jgi:hypothetical protein
VDSFRSSITWRSRSSATRACFRPHALGHVARDPR